MAGHFLVNSDKKVTKEAGGEKHGAVEGRIQAARKRARRGVSK